MKKLNLNKIIIVTGTSNGIGLAVTKHLLDSGYSVIGCSRGITDINNENFEHFSVDLSDEQQLNSFFSTLKHRKIVPYALINNAGIASLNGIISTPYAKVEEIFRVNFFATFFFIRETVKLMVRANFGRIINFSTVAKPLEIELESVYSSSKAAIEQLTKVAAREFANLNITVNAIGPGPIDTKLLKGIANERINYVLDKQIIKRKTTINDICNCLDFYLHESSSAITGNVIYLGGV